MNEISNISVSVSVCLCVCELVGYKRTLTGTTEWIVSWGVLRSGVSGTGGICE